MKAFQISESPFKKKAKESRQKYLQLLWGKDKYLRFIRPEMWGLFHCSIEKPSLINIIITHSDIHRYLASP